MFTLHLVVGEILEGTPLLVVTAAEDPAKKSCSSLGFPDGSKQCQQKKEELEVDWKISKAQAALGASRDLVTCSSKPCTHNFVWENTEWLAEKMEKFIKSIV